MRHSLVGALVLAFVLPVALAIGSPGEEKTPLVLSAKVVGEHLVIRGSDLVAGPGAEPFVTLSGEVLAVEPGFSEHEVRAVLPGVQNGSYLLTVSTARNAPQAGVLGVTLTAQSDPQPTSHQPDQLIVCASSRHMRVVKKASKCKNNETFLTLQTAGRIDVLDDNDQDSDQDSDADDTDSDGDTDGDSDGRGDDDDDDSDSDSGDDNGRASDKNKDKGKGKGKGKGNGNDADSDSDSDSD